MQRASTLLLVLLCALLCRAQSPKLFSTDRELSSSLINHLHQDRNGFIWVATEDGLNRYDGAKFIIYKHQPGDAHSLAHNFVRTLFEDSQGHLLIGTYMGLQMYDPAADRFSLPARWKDGSPFESNIVSIIERRNGELWISGNNLCRLTIEGQQLIVSRIEVPENIPGPMIEDAQQNIWISKGEEGLYRLLPNGTFAVYLSQDNGYLNSLCLDAQGRLYAGSMRKGLFVYDPQADAFHATGLPGYKDLPVSALYNAGADELYVGTDGQGLFIYNTKEQDFSQYRFDNSYFHSSSSKVHSILKDNSGNLWLAVYQKGVIQIPARTNGFKYIGHKSIDKNIIGSSCITSFCKDHSGKLWIGTDNGGIYALSEKAERLHHFTHSDHPHSVPSTILKLYEDSDRNLWVGSFINGMGLLDRARGTCTYQRKLVDPNNNYIQRVYDFAEDCDKRLWIATMGFGLYYYDLRRREFVPVSPGAESVNRWIDCLYYSPRDNKLYAGTYDGVSCIDLNVPGLPAQKILPQHVVYSIYEDEAGLIWIGSSVGLHRWDKNSYEVTTYTTTHGLPSNTVYAIEGDEQGCLWISTNAGISQFHKASDKFVNYYVGDGLQGNEFYKNASFCDEQGSIWFGGTNGITYFHPREIVNPARKWNIRITDFLLHNQPVHTGTLSGGRPIIDRPVFDAEEFHLSHKDNVFSIEFATLELNAPEHIRYEYSVNNEQWNSLPLGVNRLSFSNLEPGTYRFDIRLKDNNVYSDTKRIVIHIAPAWYASWWAKALYVLLFLLALGGVLLQVRHRYRIHQEMMQHIHAEQINEAKLQFFINISHEIRTPMSLIISPLQKLIKNDADRERQKSYQTIYRNADRILTLINQLMDVRKIDKGQMSLLFSPTDIVAFVEELCGNFEQQTHAKQISLQIHRPTTALPEVWIDVDNFDKVVLNLLANALRFTPTRGEINITFRTGEDHAQSSPLHHYLEMVIEDTGIGIDEGDLERVFDRFYQIRNSRHNPKGGTGIGLHLTRSLVELHHGSIHAGNNPEGQGCHFVVRLPLGNAHLRSEELKNHLQQSIILPGEVPLPCVPAPEEQEERSAKARPKSKYRILVVEDDEEIRNYIVRELSEQFVTQESCHGKEALDLIFRSMPDLVISDVMMPEMDGLTLCRKIKQNVNLNHIPVILLTAKTRESDNLEGLSTGADAYLMKPFNIEILQKTAENLIQTRQHLRKVFTGQQNQENRYQKLEVKSADERLMERIMKVINDRIDDPGLSVETITAEVGISRVHLYRKLKELTNQTTREFIRNTRLRQAAKLLSEKQHTVADIAILTGFNDPNNFSTAFKELYGVPPSVYMKEQLARREEEKSATDSPSTDITA